MKRLMFVVLLAVVFAFSNLAHAELVNNGGGLIYDTDFNITWYDQTHGTFDYNQAMDWATGLTVGEVTGWRLPTALNQDGSGPCSGLNCTGSELGHLFYTELHNTVDTVQNDPNHEGNMGPFTSIIFVLEPYGLAPAAHYYTSTAEYGFYVFDYWIMSFFNGDQRVTSNIADMYTVGNTVLAVHDGDVVPTPEPCTMLLLGSGLIGLAGYGRKKFFKK